MCALDRESRQARQVTLKWYEVDWMVSCGIRVQVQSRLSNNPAQTGVGTVNTTAPEVLRGDAFDGKKADTFSFGVMLWELVTRRIPWTDWKPLRVYANLVAHGCEHVKVRHVKVFINERLGCPGWLGARLILGCLSSGHDMGRCCHSL